MCRMLSNRESARRSRHRKQAHVQEIEEKATAMEVENEGMKLALARANEQELRSVEERTRLYAEIAALRTKVLHHLSSVLIDFSSLLQRWHRQKWSLCL